MHRRITLVAVIAAVALLGVACGAAQPGPAGGAGGQPVATQPVRGGTLQHGAAASEPKDLDPLTSGGDWGLAYNRLLEQRANFYEDTTLAPGLLERWSVSPDGKKYTLQVRKGVKWQNIPPVNGREFTAEDVAWNLNIWGQKSLFKSNFDGVDRVNVVDGYTVEVYTKQASAPFVDGTIGNHRIPMLPHEVYEADGNFRERVIGTGWLIFDKWEKGTSIRFHANPDYWEIGADGLPLPYVSNWVSNFLQEEPALISSFRARQLDFLGASGGILKENFDTLRRDIPDLKWQDGQRANTRFLEYNFSVKPLDDARVRQAMCLAVDQQDIINLAVGGDAKWTGLIPVSITDYAWPEEKIKQVYRPDVSRAKQVLQNAGYTNLSFELADYGGGPEYPRGAQYLQQALSAIGVQVNLRRLPTTGAATQYEASSSFQLMLAAGRTSFEVDDWISGPYASKSSRNYSKFSDPRFDQLASAQALELDTSKRKQIVEQVQDYYLQNVVACPLWHKQTEHRVWSSRLQDLTTFHWSVVWPHFQRVWIKQ